MKNKRKKAYIACNALCIDYVCFVRIMYRLRNVYNIYVNMYGMNIYIFMHF